jgi:hypothetical protein
MSLLCLWHNVFVWCLQGNIHVWLILYLVFEPLLYCVLLLERHVAFHFVSVLLFSLSWKVYHHLPLGKLKYNSQRWRSKLNFDVPNWWRVLGLYMRININGITPVSRMLVFSMHFEDESFLYGKVNGNRCDVIVNTLIWTLIRHIDAYFLEVAHVISDIMIVGNVHTLSIM